MKQFSATRYIIITATVVIFRPINCTLMIDLHKIDASEPCTMSKYCPSGIVSELCHATDRRN